MVQLGTTWFNREDYKLHGGRECLGTRIAPPLHDHKVNDISFIISSYLHTQCALPTCIESHYTIFHVESASLGTGSTSCSSTKQTFCVLRCVHSQVQPCRGGEHHTSHTLVSIGCTENCQSPDIIITSS